MTEQADSHADSSPSLQEISLETAKAELKKLTLEIEHLQSERVWKQRIASFIPLFTALISIAGFLWGVYLFNEQKEKERTTREAERISRDLNQYRSGQEQLLQFSANQNMSVARVLSLRQDLNALIDSLYPPTQQSTSVENENQKEELRKSIYNLISTDFDFTQPRHVQFDIAALQHWVDYKNGLEGGLNASIIDKYLKALGDLRYKNPNVIERIRINESDEYQEPDTLIGDPYRSVIEGFVCHLNLLSEADRMTHIRKFGSVTNNKTLAAELYHFKCPVVVLSPRTPIN